MVKLIRVDDGVGFELPESVRTALAVGENDEFFLIPKGDGFILTGDREFYEQMVVATEIMAEKRDFLRDLAD